jgi:hypothetical protein
MARGRDRLERPSGAHDAFSVRNGEIGPERQIGAGLEPLIFPEMQRPRGAMRAFRHDGRAGRRLDSSRCRGMVAMRMGHEHMRESLAAHGIEEPRDVQLVFGPWIARIIDEQAPQARHDLFYLARRKVEAPIERNILGHPRQNSAGDPLDPIYGLLVPEPSPATASRLALALAGALASQADGAIAGLNRQEDGAPRRISPRITVQEALQLPAAARQTSPALRIRACCSDHFLPLRRARVLELKDTPSA